MKQQLKDRQAEKASVIAKLEKLKEALPGLQRAEREAPVTRNFLGNPIPTAEARAATAARQEVAGEIAALEGRLIWLDQQISHMEQVVNADAQIAEGQKLEVNAQGKVDRLSDSIQRVRQRVEQIQQEQQQAEATAANDLLGAVQTLAKATASGEASAMTAAQAAVQAATVACRQAGLGAENNAALLAALEAEAEALRLESDHAESELTAARNKVKAGLRAKYGAEWDKLADELFKVGAKLASVAVQYPLSQVKVPRLRPGAASFDYADLLSAAREVRQ
ncbi:hypothetical protein D3C78_408800 [compost metagenome]